MAPAPVAPLAHSIMSYSGSGDVTANGQHAGTATSAGCYAADFTGFPVGNIALV